MSGATKRRLRLGTGEATVAAMHGLRCAVVPLCVALAAAVNAAPLTVSVSAPTRASEPSPFVMGSARTPDGHVLSLDSRSLRLDGQPWMPAMGEFHYSRYPASEWREELLKMRAGGIQIVATYVFWIHHEETEGQWNWSERRSLRDFVQTAGSVGLRVVVRCGPWCHGEVRNGGLPDWLVERGGKLRSTDPKFLAATRELYAQIGEQLRGLLWKDGGPVVGIQLDNEYRGPAEYLLALKAIAREAGLDVPLYTRTGWPALSTRMPFGEIVPLYGVYAEGFWDRELRSMPGQYWAGFHFSTLRTDAAIATELLGQREAADEPDAAKYPYLTCEIGGGMMSSYHRRIVVDPRDIDTTTLIKIAGGSSLPGYYMYHGGTNPEGRTPLMESQRTTTTNYNDLPVRTYDFQAPLGEYGEIRPQYHLLRRLHLFLSDFGSDLIGMAPALPHERPKGRDDVTTLRWAVRSDGRRGFVFLSNYERGRVLPAKPDVQLAIALADGRTVTFPSIPVTIPSGAVAWWPFNVNIGGLTLTAATAQPFSHAVESNGIRTVFFAETPGLPAEFQFPAEQVSNVDTQGEIVRHGESLIVRHVRPGRSVAIRVHTKSGDLVQCVLLSHEDSLAFSKGPFAGRHRIVLTAMNVVFDGDGLRATATAPGSQALAVFPSPRGMAANGVELPPGTDGIFSRYTVPTTFRVTAIAPTPVRPAGPLREIRKAERKEGVALQPEDGDFANAAEWSVRLPEALDAAFRPLLRVRYVGDVLRVHGSGRLETDDFYNGLPKTVGVWRLGGAKAVTLAVLPLPCDAPIYLPESARPDFGNASAIARLDGVDLIERSTVTLTGHAGREQTLPLNFRTDARTPGVQR